jgi:hypothetical protein
MTTQTSARRRETMLGGVLPLPPTLSGLVPESVRTASEEFARALEEQAEAGRDLGLARQHVEAAVREDGRLAAEAVDSGDSIPELLEPEARAKVLEAERRVEATERVATDRQRAYLEAVAEHHGQIVSGAPTNADTAPATPIELKLRQGLYHREDQHESHLWGDGFHVHCLSAC